MFTLKKYFLGNLKILDFAGNSEKFLDLAKNTNIPLDLLLISEAGAPKVRFPVFPREKCEFTGI